MIDVDELVLVHYCHPNCAPFQNICRLPKEDAFALAHKMAADNPDTITFYRFADFENYYPRRIKTDEYLYNLFVSLGGKPKEKHPLSFVLQGSEWLDNWFGNGSANRIPLKIIPAEFVSFTLGDSCTKFEKIGELTMVTKETLLKRIEEYDGTVNDFINKIAKVRYIEAQLWNDDYCTVGMKG